MQEARARIPGLAYSLDTSISGAFLYAQGKKQNIWFPPSRHSSGREGDKPSDPGKAGTREVTVGHQSPERELLWEQDLTGEKDGERPSRHEGQEAEWHTWEAASDPTELERGARAGLACGDEATRRP